MKFVMVTTFHGAESFGGDAAYVDRLSRALLGAGHEVEVIHCADAFRAVRGGVGPRPYEPPTGLRVHRLRSRWGVLSPLWTQLTGRPGPKARALRALLEAPDVDVIHFHNISLVGGAGVLGLGRDAVRIMTAHEHWLICPMHLLWKYDRRTCERPDCTACSLAGRRPPQWWRRGGSIGRGLARLDALLFPSRHALVEHRRRGIEAARMRVLPYFLPDGWPNAPLPPARDRSRPYLAAAGRLVKMKGFRDVIPLMKYLPEADLRIAGDGPERGRLEKLAAGLPNVHFEGMLGAAGLARLFADARAVVVPSRFPETFGYVVMEAYAMGTPTIVHGGGGAIRETGALSGGGIAYGDAGGLLAAMRRLVHDDALRAELAARGRHLCASAWSESAHLRAYFDLIAEVRAGRSGRTPHQATMRAGTRAPRDPVA